MIILVLSLNKGITKECQCKYRKNNEVYIEMQIIALIMINIGWMFYLGFRIAHGAARADFVA